jgi:arylsulfatase A-like enzyme
MDRRSFIKAAGCGLAAMAVGSSAFGKANKVRPNVLFLAVDDWNDMVGAMGDNQAITPNLDRLAKRGVIFTNAHAPGVYCAPSRTAVMTGLQPYNSGLYSDEPHMFNIPKRQDMPQYFRANGYKVYGCGKIYHHISGYLDRRGFDEYFIWNEEHKKDGWKLEAWGQGAPLPPEVPAAHTREYIGTKENDYYAMPNEDEEKMADTIGAKWAADFLKQKHEKPFFLAYGSYAPHKPNYAPKKYFDLYPVDKIKTPEFKEDDLDDLPPRIREVMLKKSELHRKIVKHGDWKNCIRGYLACVSYADAQVGRVLDALEKSRYAENTVVVLWSDQGYHLGEKFKWAKNTLWERTTNAPYIWAGPGVPKGVKSDVTVSLIDTYSTLIDLCGLEKLSPLDGQSLVSIFNDPGNAADRIAITTAMEIPTQNRSYSIVNRQWRYIWRDNDGEELYDLSKDPHEWYNLAGNAEYSAVKKKFAALVPQNAAPVGKGRKNKQLRLQCQGEDYKWVEGETR